MDFNDSNTWVSFASSQERYRFKIFLLKIAPYNFAIGEIFLPIVINGRIPKPSEDFLQLCRQREVEYTSIPSRLQNLWNTMKGTDVLTSETEFWLDKKEAAEFLKCDEKTLNVLADNGWIFAQFLTRKGENSRHYNKGSLQRWLYLNGYPPAST